MATTAKKTTAKTTKRKTAGAKANSKAAVVAKASSNGKGNSSKTDKSVTLGRLYQFNLFAAVANLAFAVLSVLLIGKQTAGVTLAYATKDELSSAGIGPAYRLLANVEIRYLLAAIFVISAVFSLLLATRLRNTYEAGVKNSTSGTRWVLSGITLALVLEFVTLVGGIGDLLTLKLVGGLVFTTALLAWLSERQNKGTKKQYAIFGLSVFTGVIAWLPLAGSLLFTAIYGVVNFKWYVYLLAALVLIGFLNIARNQYKHAKNGVSAKGYLQLEGKYLSVDFLIKLALFAVVLIALHK